MPEILAPVEIERKPLNSYSDAHRMFSAAKKHVEEHRQREFETCSKNCSSAAKKEIDPHWFLREFLWCVYVSGFSAKTISKKYDSLLRAHRIEDRNGNYIDINIRNAYFSALREGGEIVDGYKEVLEIFKNKRKAESVQLVRNLIYKETWPSFYMKYVHDRSPAQLEELPGLGPALSCHLARNLGNLNVCKPDVHLKRLASHYNYVSVEALCKGVSADPIGLTDLILWFASVDHGTT